MEQDYQAQKIFFDKFADDSYSYGLINDPLNQAESFPYFSFIQGDNYGCPPQGLPQKQIKEMQNQSIEHNLPLLCTEAMIPIHSQQMAVVTNQHSTSISTSQPPTKTKPQPKKGPKRHKPKNQYDKNMFYNITRVILNKMLTQDQYDQVQYYCEMHGVKVDDYLAFFKKMDLTSGWGLNQFLHFLKKQTVQVGIRKVFTYFFVSYLKEDYPAYVITEGKMHEKLKYLNCAVQMLYIPSLERSDYKKIFSMPGKK